MNSNTKTFETGNYTFTYIEKGSGNPVILVHGTLNDYRSWESQMDALAEKYRVISYSRRFHFPGNTDELYSSYTFTRHAKDLAGLINTLGMKKANLIGASYGGYVALMTAMNNPNLVKSLVLCEPPVIQLLVSNPDNPLLGLLLLLRDFTTGKSFMKFGIKALNPAKKQLEKDNLQEGVRLFTNGVLGEGGYSQLPENIKSRVMENAPALKAELLGPGFPAGFPKENAAYLTIPTLLLKGEKSPEFFHSITGKLSELLPNSRQDTIDGASHNMHQDNPETFNKKVLDFLSKHN